MDQADRNATCPKDQLENSRTFFNNHCHMADTEAGIVVDIAADNRAYSSKLVDNDNIFRKYIWGNI